MTGVCCMPNTKPVTDSEEVLDYILEKAKDALLHTRKKVIDIGIESGYPNYSYFCQSFREYFGSSPEKYRQEHTL